MTTELSLVYAEMEMLSGVRVDRFEPDIFFTDEHDGVVFALTEGKLSDRQIVVDTDYITVFEWYYNKLVREVNEARMRVEEMKRIKRD